MSADSPVVGVDLGGTKILAAVVDAGSAVVDSHKQPTPPDGPDAVVDAIAAGVAALGVTPAAVGVGAPGPVSGGVVQTAPNLPGWTSPVDLAGALRQALGVPVVVDNDVTAGTVGEWAAGAGRGARCLLGVFLGTGVGGGLVLDGRPYGGAYGGAGEFGHVIVRPDGAVCGCGRRGCIEAYAGRASMERAVDLEVAAGTATVLLDIARSRGKDRITSSVWRRALEAGDAVTTRLVDEAVAAVGLGVASAVNLLDLDRVVVGGGLAEQLGQDLADRVWAAALPHVLVPDAPRSVVVAELADLAGVVGAAFLARSRAGR